MTVMEEFFEELLRMEPHELHSVRSSVEEALTRKRQSAARTVSEAQVGGPKDTAVQKLASERLYELRWKKEWTLSDIGEHLDVSKERARQLLEKLCPIEYEADRAG